MDLRALRYFVAVAEERHVGRAAARLHMTQPPLSRAIRQLEDELGAALFDRTPRGVELTAAGQTLLGEAQALLEQADRVKARVAGASAPAVLRIGSLADSADQVGDALVAAFRRKHPDVDVQLHEADLTDPTAGLRAGMVDVALTRTPFTDAGISTVPLRAESVGVVVRSDDPCARAHAVATTDLADREWIRLPDGTDPVWTAYWTAPGLVTERPVVRTIQECLQAALWNGTLAIAPCDQTLPATLRCIPLSDRAPSKIVIAWLGSGTNPLVRSFVRLARTRT